jgi:hypothetical protein
VDESLSFQHQINPPLGDQLFSFIGDLAPSRLVGRAPLALHFSPRAAARACVTMFLHRRTRALIPSLLPLFMAHHRYAPPVFLFTQSVSRKYRSSSTTHRFC